MAGKVFTRTGRPEVRLRIHNALREGTRDPACRDLPDCPLLHRHAPDLDSFLRAFRFRHTRGAYRAGLKPAPGGGRLHDLLAALEAEGGEAALARFYRDVCTATPELRARLHRHGLLREIAFDPAATRARSGPAT